MTNFATVVTSDASTPLTCNGFFDDDAPAGQGTSYYIIRERLVPSAFIDQLAAHLVDVVFDHDEVISPRDVCGEDFWEALDANEKAVIPDCLALLIKQHRLAIRFDGRTDADYRPDGRNGFSETPCY